MNAQRAIKMVAAAAFAYYFGYFAVSFVADLGRIMAGAAGAHPSAPFDPAISSWWTARASAITGGLICAAAATAIHFWFARRRGERKPAPALAFVTLVVAVQPLLQYTIVQRSVLNRFNRGDASAAAALPNLGMGGTLPSVIERLRRGGPDAFELAQSAMNFSGGPGEVQVVARDRTASPAARFSAALALSTRGPESYGMEAQLVIDQVMRESDEEFRVSVPRRLKASGVAGDQIRGFPLRRALLLDSSPRVRLAALKDHESMAGCDVMPGLVTDPVREIQLAAFLNLRYCHWEQPKSENVRAERIAIYRKLLDHPEFEIRIRSGNALALLGDQSGTEAALQFVEGDPYGKNAELLVLAIATVAQNRGEASAPMLYTIWKCDRAEFPQGHYYEARNAADDALDRIYGYGKWPPQYKFGSTAPAPMLPEFCVR